MYHVEQIGREDPELVPRSMSPFAWHLRSSAALVASETMHGDAQKKLRT